MKATAPFRFKQFTIRQNVNPQKVGTDSMLLGAWSKGNFNHILDIGTGTGILALMMAQQNPNARLIALEPDTASLAEAIENFNDAVFKHQITGIESSLQQFESAEKFDLIISNPPYFENSTLSANENKNRARHTDQLPLADLYKCAAMLLHPLGKLNLVFPADMEPLHVEEAKQHALFPQEILRTVREDGTFKRTLISFAFNTTLEIEKTLLVKFSNNSYSPDFIELTRDFYATDLAARQK